jgi:hypothetical protein
MTRSGSVAQERTGPQDPGEPKSHVGFTGDELRTRLRAYDRTPFLDLLAVFLEASPTYDDIRKLGKAFPDRYVNALVQLSRTGGYTDKTESSINVNLNVGRMSDSMLEDQLRAMAEQLSLPVPMDQSAAGGTHNSNGAAIDAEFVEVRSPTDETPA